MYNNIIVVSSLVTNCYKFYIHTRCKNNENKMITNVIMCSEP